uniref:Uncharacterized protein n=1 Tax=Rattus norvegicus TaxID=10116 RepID=A0A8I6AWY6_RAT
MAKATKKSKNTTSDVEPSTSSAKSKKAKTCYQYQTRAGEKKSRWSGSDCSVNVQKTTKKAKRTLPRIAENNTSEKTVPPTKKTKRAKDEQLFGHYHRLMDEISTSTERGPEQSSTDSSSASTSDEESQ